MAAPAYGEGEANTINGLSPQEQIRAINSSLIETEFEPQAMPGSEANHLDAFVANLPPGLGRELVDAYCRNLRDPGVPADQYADRLRALMDAAVEGADAAA